MATKFCPSWLEWSLRKNLEERPLNDVTEFYYKDLYGEGYSVDSGEISGIPGKSGKLRKQGNGGKLMNRKNRGWEGMVEEDKGRKRRDNQFDIKKENFGGGRNGRNGNGERGGEGGGEEIGGGGGGEDEYEEYEEEEEDEEGERRDDGLEEGEERNSDDDDDNNDDDREERKSNKNESVNINNDKEIGNNNAREDGNSNSNNENDNMNNTNHHIITGKEIIHNDNKKDNKNENIEYLPSIAQISEIDSVPRNLLSQLLTQFQNIVPSRKRVYKKLVSGEMSFSSVVDFVYDEREGEEEGNLNYFNGNNGSVINYDYNNGHGGNNEYYNNNSNSNNHDYHSNNNNNDNGNSSQNNNNSYSNNNNNNYNNSSNSFIDNYDKDNNKNRNGNSDSDDDNIDSSSSSKSKRNRNKNMNANNGYNNNNSFSQNNSFDNTQNSTNMAQNSINFSQNSTTFSQNNNLNRNTVNYYTNNRGEREEYSQASNNSNTKFKSKLKKKVAGMINRNELQSVKKLTVIPDKATVKISYSASDLRSASRNVTLGTAKNGPCWSKYVRYAKDVILNDNIMYGGNVLQQREQLDKSNNLKSDQTECWSYYERKVYQRRVRGCLVYGDRYHTNGDLVRTYSSSVRYNGDLTGMHHAGYVILLERCSSYLYSKTGD